jgi:predicted Zn-dependent protease with MMP-like domain
MPVFNEPAAHALLRHWRPPWRTSKRSPPRRSPRFPRSSVKHVGNVRIQIDDFPSDDVEKQMELDTPFDLLGLYQGVSMAERGAGHVANDIDRIFLYRRPILDYWCESGEDLPHIVRHVLIHEIGHHFGLSDDDMEAIEAKAEEESQRAEPRA